MITFLILEGGVITEISFSFCLLSFIDSKGGNISSFNSCVGSCS